MKYLLTTLLRETDLYKSGDFFLNPIMILLNCIFVYYYGNGNMDNYGQKNMLILEHRRIVLKVRTSSIFIGWELSGRPSVCPSVRLSVHTFKPEYL